MASVRINPEVFRWAMTRGEKGLWAAGEHLRGALRITLSGQRHGRWYRVPGTKKDYQASAPGEAPAVRTGDLKKRVASSLERNADESTLMVGTNAPQGKILEFGTSQIAPRPWMRPTVTREWAAMKERFAKASGFLVK